MTRTLQPVGDPLEPLNDRLERKPPVQLKLVPRGYQQELSLKALEQNVIVYLGTGLGKTFITTLYLTFPQVDEMIQDGKRVVFLAPTQDLVKQQAEYINKQVPYRVKLFCGRSAHCGQHIDFWSRETWSKELDRIELPFMTPQIFTSAISTNLIDWSRIGAVIFDEVHHACRTRKMKESNHPYAQILAHYRDYFIIRPEEPKPRLIGLTASLINCMPKDRDSITSQVRYLEKILFARCVTNVDVQDIRPKMVIHSFSTYNLEKFNDILCAVFTDSVTSLKSVFNTEKYKQLLVKGSKLTKEEERIAAYYNRLKLAAAGFSIKPGSFPKVLDGLLKVRQRCGLWALKIICSRLIIALEKHDKNASLLFELKQIYNQFTNILRLLKSYLDSYLDRDTYQGLLKYTRPKCMTLLELLKLEHERALNTNDAKTSFSCIIFVRSRLEVLALNLWLQAVSQRFEKYRFIKCDYAIGISATMSSKYSCITKRKATDQHRMLNQFRQGLLNVIVTTSVLEEGIDLPSCSTVIRYDQPNTFREFVQSRGRARQTISSFVALTEDTKKSIIIDKLNKFNDFEYAIKDVLQSSDIGSCVRSSIPRPAKSNEELDDYLLINDNKIRISSSTARTLLHMYCQGLAKFTPFAGRIHFDRLRPSTGTFQTILYLPSGCPLSQNGITGNVKYNMEDADNSAVVAAVRALYDAKELDENGVPVTKSGRNVDAFLDNLHLKPDFESMEKELSSSKCRVIEIETKKFFMIEPQYTHLPDYLSRNFADRTYKLIRIRFVPQSNCRSGTRAYFENSIYGMIVDSSVPDEFIQPFLYSHYGNFEVQYQNISDNISISRREDHTEYLNYTHKFITRCLQLKNINREDFRYKCHFYIVLLDGSDRPDIRRMRSFCSSNRRLAFNHIAKLRFYFRPKGFKGINEKSNLFLVKAIHKDLNAHSRIPGRRDRKTFLEDAEYKYGRGILTTVNQPVIEVMPISKEFARSKVLKIKRQDYNTSNLFFLEQFLEYFDDQPAAIFQAYNIPMHIFNLYRILTALELEKKFLSASAEWRDTATRKVTGHPTELVVDIPENMENEVGSGDCLNIPEDDIQKLSNDQDSDVEDATVDDDDEVEGKDEDEYDDDASISSAELESTEDEDEQVGVEYRDLLHKQTFDMDSQYKEEVFPKWDMSQYQEKNMKTLTYEHRHSTSIDWFKNESAAQNAEDFLLMKRDVDDMQSSLLALIERTKCILTSDGTFLDEDKEFEKRTAVVDREIIPEVFFDKTKKPLMEASRTRSLLEALTQKRALDTYNLETLENVGDSYLKYATSVVLFQSLEGNEGFLTAARSRLVCNRHFTLLARRNNLGSYISAKDFSRDLVAFTLGQRLDAKLVESNYIKISEKQLADIFEAIIGSHLLYRGEYEAILAMKWLGLNIFKESCFATFNEKSVVFSSVPNVIVDKVEAKSYMKSCKRKVGRFEDIISYKFGDASFLVQALTHASSTEKCTRSYERLEFLGDAILDYLVTINLVVLGELNDPGQITTSRSALVNNVALARIAIKYKYDLFIQHASHDLYDELVKLRSDMEEDPELTNLDMLEYDRIVKLLGDVFESVAAAIYLDSGCSLDTVWSVYYPMMKDSIDNEIKCCSKNIISLLYETFTGANRIVFEKYDVKEAHDSSLVGVRCTIKGFGSFEGVGTSHKVAKLRSVKKALENAPIPKTRRNRNR